jgi:hypothetical protein
MRHFRPSSAALAASAVLVLGTLLPVATLAQPAPKQPQQQQQPAQSSGPSPVKPYKPVAIKPPQPLADPSFEAFRKQLAAIAEKKDRAGLAKLVAQNFFWIVQDKDSADKKKPGIDNLAKAINLDADQGWELLAAYAAEATAEPDPDHKGVVCAPADPSFDENAASALATETQTDPAEWGYPAKDGLEVHEQAKADSPVVEKLGLYLIRVVPDDSPANAVAAEFVRVATPSGKTGYVTIDSLLPLGNDQMCYVKDGGNWKIAGFIGGGSE